MGISDHTTSFFCRYSKFKDRFLRVGFANDALQALNHTDLAADVVGRFRGMLLHGLDLCNRKFVFLGLSCSQQRDHGCWLYCEEQRHKDNAPTAEQIRASAGDLHEIKIASKYAARLAQCFSSTYQTLELSSYEICDMPEVQTSKGELFSDGVGIVTSSGMDKVIRKLPSAQQARLAGADVSAVQIRMGGCKGVLARWDGIRCYCVTSDAFSCLTYTTALFRSCVNMPCVPFATITKTAPHAQLLQTGKETAL